LAQKVNNTEFTEQLNTKANKQSVSNALHRKANKQEIETVLNAKADTSALNVIAQQVHCKVDLDLFEKQFARLVDARVDREDLFFIKEQLSQKADKN